MLIKILIVDDSASDRLIINKMLSEYSILTAWITYTLVRNLTVD